MLPLFPLRSLKIYLKPIYILFPNTGTSTPSLLLSHSYIEIVEVKMETGP